MTILNPETIEQLRGLELRARAVVEGAFAGGHRSQQRGFSVEFADYREYTVGDDLRYVDWKVFARRDRVYVKQFETETDFQCHLVLDVSESMAYRSDQALLSKWEYAQLVAAALCGVVVRQQDRAGITTLTDRLQARARPTGNLSDLVQFLEQVAPVAVPSSAAPSAEIDLGQSFHELAETLGKRGVVLILSDCLTAPESLLLGLRHLRYRGHEVSLLHIVDPAEQDFPFDDPLVLKGLEGLGEQRVDARWLASAYREEFRGFQERLEQDCRDHHIDYRLTRTDTPPEEVLRAFLSGRLRDR